tara:strand:- start:87 stop:323 length:237 start_codon:yes stop_codon:yes gene_type:complete
MKIIQINFVKLDGSQMRGAPRVGLEIDLSHTPKLTELRCEANSLSELDLSHTPKLTELFCYSNQLSELDLAPALEAGL